VKIKASLDSGRHFSQVFLALPARKPRRKFGDPLPEKHLERDIREAIRGAINRLPWARVWLNQEHFTTMPNGEQGYLPGLCQGSADLVGIVRRDALAMPDATLHGTLELARDKPPRFTVTREPPVGVFVAIETKTREKRNVFKKNQKEWLAFVERMGGFAGVAYTLGQGLDIVARARGVPMVQVVDELETIVGRRVCLE